MTRAMMIICGCVLCVALAGAATTCHAGADADAAASESQVIREGVYRMSYFGKTLGTETFEITRTSTGYVINARLDSNLDSQVSSEGTYELDANRRLIRATYRPFDGSGIEAEYTVTDGSIVSVARKGDDVVGEQVIELDSDTVIAGPHYVTDFFVLEPLGHRLKEEKTYQAVTFGFDGWKINPDVTMKTTRDKDRTLRNEEDRKVSTSVYRCDITTGDDRFKTQSWLDADGVSLRITVAAPIGKMTVRLQPIDET
ncbi:MAG: hypothetical protein AAF432_14645 [Planctomycetota bacterium]